VTEPNGSVCSWLNRQTVGGGVLIGDTLGEVGGETYVAAQAFPGTYKVTVEQVWSRPLGGKAKVEVIRHQGTAKETEEQGVRFLFISLNMKMSLIPFSSSGVAPPPSLSEASPGPRVTGTVPVIDHEDHLRRVAEQLLRRDGFRVLTAVDGADGLRMYQRHAGEIDVVLLDLTMPGLSGVAVYRRLRELDPQLAILLTGGYDAEEVWQQVPASERSAYLEKPYRGDDLKAKVREILGKRRQAPVGP
jgi:CheY-like chemotaxis protein